MSTATSTLALAAVLPFVVRTPDGKTDELASLNKFRDALGKFTAERETEETTIAAAVTEVFDENKGVNINMPALQSLVLHKLNVSPATFKVMGDRVAEYVRAHSSAKREEGGLYKIGKGKGGGVSRWSDVPEKNEPEAGASAPAAK
jgi:predicted secreted protein